VGSWSLPPLAAGLPLAGAAGLAATDEAALAAALGLAAAAALDAGAALEGGALAGAAVEADADVPPHAARMAAADRAALPTPALIRNARRLTADGCKVVVLPSETISFPVQERIAA
jgi:hypothetical protein